MKSPRHPMDRPNRPTDRCKGASTCTTQQPMRPAAALPRSTPSPAIDRCRPPAPDTRATTPPHAGWTPLGPILWAHTSRGCAALTRGYRSSATPSGPTASPSATQRDSRRRNAGRHAAPQCSRRRSAGRHAAPQYSRRRSAGRHAAPQCNRQRNAERHAALQGPN